MKHYFYMLEECKYLNELPYIKENGEDFKEYPTIKMEYNMQHNYFKIKGSFCRLPIFEYESDERYDYLINKQYRNINSDYYYNILFLFKTLKEMEYCREFIDLTNDDYVHYYTINNHISSDDYDNYVSLLHMDRKTYVLKHNFSYDEINSETGNYVCKFGHSINYSITIIDEERFIITNDLKIKPIGFCEDYKYIYDPPINKLVLE